jgi:chromosome partitioning protein
MLLIVTVASYKGGAGKTTTAIHLARYLQTLAPTLLLDGDETRNATAWNANGKGFPFRVADLNSAALLAAQFKHVVIDTGQRPTDADLKALAEGCNLLVIPTVPSGIDTVSLVQTVRALRECNATYRVLITKAPPAPEQEAQQLRANLSSLDIPLFAADIPRLKAFDKAFHAGVSVDDVKGDPNAARAWKAYQAAGKEIVVHGRTKQIRKGA